MINLTISSSVIPSCDLYLNDSIICRPPGNRLVEYPDGSIQIIPKTIGEIIGERILRPLIDTSYPLLKRTFCLIHQGFGSLHNIVSKINFLTVASAQTFPNHEASLDSEKVPVVLELLSDLLRPLIDISLFRDIKFQQTIKNTFESKIPNEKLDGLLKMIHNHLEQLEGATFAEKFQKASLQVIQDSIEVIKYLRENIQGENESTLSNNNQKYIYSKLRRFLNLVELYKKTKAPQSSFEKLLSIFHFSNPVQVEPEEFKIFDHILKNVRNIKMVNEFEFARRIATGKIVSALNDFIEPATLDDDQKAALRKNIMQAMDTIIEGRIAEKIIELVDCLESYVEGDQDLTMFVNNAGPIFLNLLSHTYTLIVPNCDFQN